MAYSLAFALKTNRCSKPPESSTVDDWVITDRFDCMRHDGKGKKVVKTCLSHTRTAIKTSTMLVQRRRRRRSKFNVHNATAMDTTATTRLLEETIAFGDHSLRHIRLSIPCESRRRSEEGEATITGNATHEGNVNWPEGLLMGLQGLVCFLIYSWYQM